MKNRSSAGAATFDTFENPVTDGDDAQGLDGERSPTQGDRSPASGSDGDRSPTEAEEPSVFELEDPCVFLSASRVCTRRAAVQLNCRAAAASIPTADLYRFVVASQLTDCAG